MTIKAWPPGVPREIEIGEQTLWDRLADQVSKTPDNLAIDFLDRETTWSQLQQEAVHLAGGLQSLGVERGDRVVLFAQNCPHFVTAFYAILKCGAVVVPVNPMNKGVELAHCIRNSGAKTAITSDDLASVFADAGRELSDEDALRGLIVFSVAEYLGGTDGVPEPWQPWLCHAHEVPTITNCDVRVWSEVVGEKAQPSSVETSADDLALLMYTSGTTGFPKACMHSHRTIAPNAILPQYWQDMRPGDVSLVAVPLFHITGLVGGLLGSVSAGASLVLMPRWDRCVALQAIDKRKATHWTNIPTMVMDLLAEPTLSDFDLSSLRYIGGGGAAMPDAVAVRLKGLVGLDYLEGYGLTETAAPTHANPMNAPKYQCLGIPVINTQACILDIETMQEARSGEQGEILVAGPQVFLGYWQNESATKAAFIELNGRTWFRTGDLGHVDADGYYFIADRLKRMINASGFKVWPAELEGLLHNHPAVQEVCVIAKKDPYRGQTVKALIVRKVGEEYDVPEADIRGWARENMSAYKVPKEVEFVEALPKGATGKILWRALQAEQDVLDSKENITE